jgi:hypothetical protein
MRGTARPAVLPALVVLVAMTPAPLLAQRWDVGLSASGTVIEGVARPGAPAGAPTVLLVGGLDGTTAGETRVREALASDRRTDVRLVGIADGNPDGSPLAFPPQDTAYRQNPESHALWRWIGVHAPDLVLIAGEDSGLAAALSAGEVAGVGAIPARRVTSGGALLDEIPAAIPPSPARLERSRRQARTPAQVAAELAAGYGHAFDQVTYLPGMALNPVASISLYRQYFALSSSRNAPNPAVYSVPGGPSLFQRRSK